VHGDHYIRTSCVNLAAHHGGRIYPPDCERLFWSERIGIKLTGCYEEIEKTLNIPSLLKRDDWTSQERAVLESWL